MSHHVGDVAECMLDLVAQVPPGSVSTYGRIALETRLRTGAGSARAVGNLLARHGAQVPWWRIVNAAGQPPGHLADDALARLRAEGVPIRGDRVELRAALHTFSALSG